MAKLVTENISKRFKNQDVLKHINITLENNEVYGLLGINGAGKTNTYENYMWHTSTRFRGN